MKGSVYEQLREAIISGQIKPGATLSENTLASEYGASRTPVREALHRLEIETLVVRNGRTVSVRETSPEEILDIYFVRVSLEGAAARAAAERATELDLARLRASAEAMREAGPDPKERARRNRSFHETLWAASHSPTLLDLLSRLNVHLIRYPSTTLESDARWLEALNEHEAILAAITDGDGTLAQELAERHMVAAREVRLRMVIAEQSD